MKLYLRSVVGLVLLALVTAPLAWANAPKLAPDWAQTRDAVAGEVLIQLSLDAFHNPGFRTGMLPAGRTGLADLDARLAQLDAREIAPVFDLTTDAQRKSAMGMDRVFVVRFTGSEDPARVAARLATLPEVASAEPNGIYHAMATPNDTYYPNQWAHNNTGQAVSYGGGLVGTVDCDTDTDQAWDLQTGSSSLVLAIIDTGVDTGHPEFAGRTVAGYDFINDDADPMDDEGHGTCCAGIAVGAGNNAQGIAGVAWGVKLMPVKVLDSDGSGSWAAIANGITWAADHGAKVLSLSLGGSGYSAIVETAVNYAFGKGCALFCASGNNNSSILSYPAAYANTIAVGALSPCNQRKDPSSCDGEYWWGSNYGTGLDFLAPGTRIHTADIRGSGGYGSGDYITDFNGTSAATPHAAGIGALVWSQNPALSNVELRSNLRAYCDDLATAGYDVETGYGRLNAYQSVLNAGSGGSPSPWTLFAEDFEWNAVPGTVFSATDTDIHSGLDYWGDQSSSTGARVHGGSCSAYCADNSNVPGQKYDNSMNASMTLINPIAIGDHTDVRLSFWSWCQTSNAADYLSFQVWNGSGWTEQQRWYGSHYSTWKNTLYSVTGSTLKFRFIFYSNSSGTDQGAYVDDIVVTGTPGDEFALNGPTTLTYLSEQTEPDESAAVSAPRVSAASDLAIAWARGSQPQAQLSFVLPQSGGVRLEVFGIDGRRVAVLADGDFPAGPHAFVWPTAGTGDAASGVYYARLAMNGQSPVTRPLVLVR